MSIQSDVEKKMREDLESREKKDNKKKKKSRLLGLIIILLLLAALLALLNWLGLGLGGGKGAGGDGSGNEETTPKESAAATESEEEPEYFDIKVSGSTYIIVEDNSVADIDQIINRVTGLKDNYIVRIHNDNATANAIDDLEGKLKDEGRNFIEADDDTEEQISAAAEEE
ncbi:MAG: hypothetical protein IJ571_08800 [Ruminococcus sp.]|nr:hypothetical protein [Ruminococcus sp.]